jgi:transcriptional regulator with XRE-family HTH domain
MSDVRIGHALRVLRHNRGWRQVDLAREAGVSAPTVSRLESGRLASVTVAVARRVFDALDARLDVRVLWHGGELDRLVDRRHAAMAEAVSARLRAGGWTVAAEATFSIYGERGSVDILGWRPGPNAVLVVELKTELTDLQALISGVDRKRRLAPLIARERGWTPTTVVGTWVLVLDTRTNRRRLAAYSSLLRSTFPVDGRGVDAWLRAPGAPLAALGFLTNVRHAGLADVSSGRVRATSRMGHSRRERLAGTERPERP